MESNHKIQIRRIDLVLIKKKKRTCHLEDFPIIANRRVIMKKCEQNLTDTWTLLERWNMSWNMKLTVTLVISPWKNFQELGKMTRGTGDQKNWVHQDHSNIKISLDTWKSPENLTQLIITQTKVSENTCTHQSAGTAEYADCISTEV